MQRILLGIINVDFDAAKYQLQVMYSNIRKMLEKKWEYNESVHQLFTDFKKTYDSAKRGVLYNIHIEFSIPMKPVRLTNMCLTETYCIKCGKFLD